MFNMKRLFGGILLTGGLLYLAVDKLIGKHYHLQPTLVQPITNATIQRTTLKTTRLPDPDTHKLDDFPVPDKCDGLFLDISPVFFEPEVEEDFPTNDEDPKIPHIIHQTYKTELIPETSAPLVKSFVKLNPNWTYFFWTDRTAREFLEDKYKYFLPIWDAYQKGVYRADALRYFVLYEYGGVYADIDFECLRPLDRVTKKYPAIFPLEPFEHSVFRMGMPYLINNAIMMSRPKHRFLKYLLEKLPFSANKTMIIDVAGPWFVTDRFKEYHNISKSEADKMESKNSSKPFLFTGTQHLPGNDKIYVPNSHYFMNTLANNFALASFRSVCNLWLQGKTSQFRLQDGHLKCRTPTVIEKRACNEIRRRESRSVMQQSRFTYTKHHWFSTYYQTNVKLDKTVDIRSIVPNLRMYSGNMTVVDSEYNI